MEDQKINLALLVELQALVNALWKDTPPGYTLQILDAKCKLDAALAPLLKHEVEVMS